jgi:hypothetical protein
MRASPAVVEAMVVLLDRGSVIVNNSPFVSYVKVVVLPATPPPGEGVLVVNRLPFAS